MRVMILTTAFAARGAGAATRRIAADLALAGIDVTVVAPEDAADPPAGVTLERVAEYPPVISRRDRLQWVLHMNAALLARASAIIDAKGADVVHAVGWHVAWAAAGAARTFGVPLVATLRPSDPKRDLPGDHARVARDARAWLARQAGRSRTLSPRVAPSRVIETYTAAVRLRRPATRRRVMDRVAATDLA